MLVAFEGIDSSGKATQTKLLQEALITAGYTVATFQFPSHRDTFGSSIVSKYLQGEFGVLVNIPHELTALAYALDRFEMKKEILQAMAGNDFVLVDRYIYSNLAYHSADTMDPQDQWETANDLLQLETVLFGMPRPDLNILLDMPVDGAVARRRENESEEDIHEEDDCYMEQVKRVYRRLTLWSQDTWRTVDTYADDKPLSKEAIASEVYQHVMEVAAPAHS